MAAQFAFSPFTADANVNTVTAARLCQFAPSWCHDLFNCGEFHRLFRTLLSQTGLPSDHEHINVFWWQQWVNYAQCSVKIVCENSLNGHLIPISHWTDVMIRFPLHSITDVLFAIKMCWYVWLENKWWATCRNLSYVKRILAAWKWIAWNHMCLVSNTMWLRTQEL